MTVTRLGIQTPQNLHEHHKILLSEYEDLSGMEYQVFAHKHADLTYIGVSHDAVGLVTWWVAANAEEAEEWVHEQMAQARREAADESWTRLREVIEHDPDPRALNGALLQALVTLGAAGSAWNGDIVAHALEPVIAHLRDRGIPSLTSTSEDDVAFWEGAAEASPW